MIVPLLLFLFVFTPEFNSSCKTQAVTIPIPVHLSLAYGREIHDNPLHDVIPLKKLQWPALPLSLRLKTFSPVLPSLLLWQFVTQQCHHFAPARQNSPHALVPSYECFTLYELTPIPPKWLFFLPWQNTSQKTYSAKSYFMILGKHRAVFQDWSFLQVETLSIKEGSIFKMCLNQFSSSQFEIVIYLGGRYE